MQYGLKNQNFNKRLRENVKGTFESNMSQFDEIWQKTWFIRRDVTNLSKNYMRVISKVMDTALLSSGAWKNYK